MKEEEPRPERTLLLIFGVLALLIFVTPFLSAPGTITGLSGGTGTIDHAGIWKGLDPLSSLVYQTGDLLCHQKEERSLILNGNQMPVCARDAGLFLGVPMGFLALVLVPRRAPLWAIIALGAPTVIDGGVQLFTDYESTNAIRFVTGTAAGAGLAFLMMYFYDSMALRMDRRGEAGRNKRS